jgi:hypothetical protein
MEHWFARVSKLPVVVEHFAKRPPLRDIKNWRI